MRRYDRVTRWVHTVARNINILRNMLISRSRVADCVCKHVSKKPHVRVILRTFAMEQTFQ